MTKKGLLTKAERTMMEKLLEDSQFKGKEFLRHLIWMNTTKPKFKVGDCFKITERGHYFFGVPATNINAKIVEIRAFRGEYEYVYSLEAHIVNKDGREIVGRLNARESHLRIKVKNNENRIDGNDKFEQSMDVYL